MSKTESVASGCLVALLVLVIMACATLVSTWITMVVWGALALTFGFKTIGFGSAFLVSLALTIVGGYFRATRSG